MRFGGCQGPQLVPWTTRITPCRALPRFVARCPCWKSPHQRDLQRLFQQVPASSTTEFGKNLQKTSRFNMHQEGDAKHFLGQETTPTSEWHSKNRWVISNYFQFLVCSCDLARTWQWAFLLFVKLSQSLYFMTLKPLSSLAPAESSSGRSRPVDASTKADLSWLPT